ncbi:MAG: LD-carboxypeptidase [Desulfobacterales bacterium]|jgi:muramoyltetrapeptide carboxypeptidase
MAKHRKKIITPPRLRPGDTIGIAAPASPFDRQDYEQGIATLQSLGYLTRVSRDIFLQNGYLAGSDLQRAKLINRFFADRSIKAILCARGGYGSMRILPLLDFALIRKNPKIFVGFSDITALLAALYEKSRLVTYHGPLLTTLGESDQNSKDALILALSSHEKIDIRLPKGITVVSGSVAGPVLAGNLTTLCHLVGTPYEPSLEGHILLLEDKGEATYRLDRMLVQMKFAGCFEGLAGMVLGSFERCGQQKELLSVVRDIFAPFPFPILAGLDMGHSRSNLTIPIGREATLDADQHSLVFHGPATAGAVS